MTDYLMTTPDLSDGLASSSQGVIHSSAKDFYSSSGHGGPSDCRLHVWTPSSEYSVQSSLLGSISSQAVAPLSTNLLCSALGHSVPLDYPLERGARTPDPSLSHIEALSAAEKQSASPAPPPAIAQAIAATVVAVDWECIGAWALRVRGTGGSFTLGKLVYGAFNVIRFIRFDDGTTWVARVPQLLSLNIPPKPEEHRIIAERMSSEVASLRYVSSHTSIPVPIIYYWTFARDGDGAGLPFTLMSTVAGEQLSKHWTGMSEGHRSRVLEQIAAMYLELSQKCRFSMIGSLQVSPKHSGETGKLDEEWVLGKVQIPPFVSLGKKFTGGPYRCGLEYWLEYTTSKLDTIREKRFGNSSNVDVYAALWLMRSLVPHLYDVHCASLDANGFALMPADFHTHNIMIDIEANNGPIVTGILDWDWSSTLPSNAFATFPIFIVDHPLWEEDDERFERIEKEQEIFLEHLRSAERKSDPSTPLSEAFFYSRPTYLLDQALDFNYQTILEELWSYVYGDNGRGFVSEVVSALLEGALKPRAAEFERDIEVLKDVRRALGDAVPTPVSKDALLALVRDHAELAEAQKWLESV